MLAFSTNWGKLRSVALFMADIVLLYLVVMLFPNLLDCKQMNALTKHLHSLQCWTKKKYNLKS